MLESLWIGFVLFIPTYFILVPFFAGFCEDKTFPVLTGLTWPIWLPLWIIGMIGDWIYRMGDSFNDERK